MRLLHFVRAHVPRSMTAVEEPGYHLKEGYAQCPHCEQVYSTIGISDLYYGKTTEPWLAKFSAQIKAADAVIRKAEGGQ